MKQGEKPESAVVRRLNSGSSLGEGDKGIYRSSHWQEPNVLAHVRLNDRTGPNGEKVLHIEEVQSDWHQEGRRKGYKGNRWEVFDSRTGEVKYYVESEEEAKKLADENNGYDYEGPNTNYNGMVPDAPLKPPGMSSF